MWDEIQDMPGEIFDISDETKDEMIAWYEEQEENETPGWDLYGFDDQDN
ncbi:hypothetical protein SCREM1_142 [Synechococcus phage S-CREM1]|nr:hypothetical protein SCREM1_142 [Synechococcus phage S-CREM1]